MNENHKDIIIAVLITFIVTFAILLLAEKTQEKSIEDCINAGNRPIPCVEAVLPDQ